MAGKNMGTPHDAEGVQHLDTAATGG